MIISIMQPYLFPYIDYYRLIYLADIHVVLDDVNFIKKVLLIETPFSKMASEPV